MEGHRGSPTLDLNELYFIVRSVVLERPQGCEHGDIESGSINMHSYFGHERLMSTARTVTQQVVRERWRHEVISIWVYCLWSSHDSNGSRVC